MVEVNRPNRQLRRRRGKDDTTDAEAAARAALNGEATALPKTGDGPVEATRMLRVVRRSAVKARTQAANQIHALVVTAPEQVKHQLRDLPTRTQVKVCARFRPGTAQTTAAYAKRALRLLARRYQNLDTEITQVDKQIRLRPQPRSRIIGTDSAAPSQPRRQPPSKQRAMADRYQPNAQWSRCRHCGFRCYRVWDRRPKRVRDLGVSGRRGGQPLVWRRRRFECGNCGERHLQDHALFGAGLTRRFARRLVADATVMSMSGSVPPSWGGLASDHGPGPRGGGAGGAASPGPAVSCAVGRRNVDTAPAPVCDCGRLWRQRQGVGDDPGPYERVAGQVLPRSGSLVVPPGGDSRERRHPAHIRAQSHNTCQLLAMCWTGSTSYAGSPKASPWYDARYNAATPTGVPQRSNRTCSETCFTLLRRADHPNRSPPGAPRQAVRRSSPSPHRPGRPLQELYQLYEADDPDQANQALGRFADLYATGQIPQYQQIVDTIIAWGEQILAYHTTRRATNGPPEGINNLHPSPTTRRPRVHQPQQLRRPRNPRNTHTCRVFSAGAGLTLLVTGLWCLCHDLSTWPPPGSS